MLTIFDFKTITPSKVNFYRFQMLTVPSSLPVASVQYLAEAEAAVN
jgi:hypothetical protein